jgi:catechol 2,3-dioxygenase-like lactoylglutathione lyase family enzyme
MRLPGHGEEGPILELFEYTQSLERPKSSANEHGYNHIGFEVANVEATMEAVIAGGGTRLGEIVDFEAPSDGVVTFVFLRDPEDNIIQLIHYPE